ncbi:MAG TPA: hypothetical protein VNB24_08925 [Acidimicrobiales bacterium]|nr:hypothetical protein [Acidimicrobiales bacterium]
MSRSTARVLQAFAAWTLFVWLTRIKNVFDADRGATFIAVHLVLAGVSVAFAVATFALVRKERAR